MHAIWNAAQKQTVEFLGNVTMADMLTGSHHKPTGDHTTQLPVTRS
jgi:hypothetical protein